MFYWTGIAGSKQGRRNLVMDQLGLVLKSQSNDEKPRTTRG